MIIKPDLKARIALRNMPIVVPYTFFPKVTYLFTPRIGIYNKPNFINV